MALQAEVEYPLRKMCKTWTRKLNRAIQHKQKQFGDDAEEAMNFFDGPYTWMWDTMHKYGANRRGFVTEGDGEGDEAIGAPSIQISVNKVAEVRDLFGPSLYHRNPTVIGTPHALPTIPPEALGATPMTDPTGAMQQQFAMLAEEERQNLVVKQFIAELVQAYINYIQFEQDKKTHARRALDEALIKGAGLLEHRIDRRPGFSVALIGSFYRSIDDLLIDPDAEDIEDVLWIALRGQAPYWKLEDDWDLEPESLKVYATGESHEHQAVSETDPHDIDERARGISNDLVTYYDIYSKMGMGQRLKDAKFQPELAIKLEEFGDYCHLVIVKDCPYPLNLPNQKLRLPNVIVTQKDQAGNPLIDPLTQGPVPEIDPSTGEPAQELNPELYLSAQWPIPYWIDGGWPVEMIAFRRKPSQVWPISIIKPGIGYLRFINWVFSFLAVKVRHACITTVGVKKLAGQDVKDQLLSPKDFKVLEIEEATGGRIEENVSFLQPPPFNHEIYNMVDRVMREFEKATGLMELLYGLSPTQPRTATESQIKQGYVSIRPDDMSSQTEDWLSRVAAKEAMAAAWLLRGKDVLPALGAVRAQLWDQYVATTDLERISREFSWRIEAGSSRKPNKDTQIAQANDSLAVFMPFMQFYTQATGDVGPVNALIQRWAKANDTPMPLLMPPPPPPPQPPAAQAA